MTVNVHVEPLHYESVDQLIKRFLKKCKKEAILRSYYDHTEFKNKRQKLEEKRARHKARMRKKKRFR